MWFERLMGFEETSHANVHDKLEVRDNKLISLVNGKSFQFGELELISLDELKRKSPPREAFRDKLKVSQIVANVSDLHQDDRNTDAMFQAASQFNLLEMVSPHITPEYGVDGYERDYTQGPACAIACGAGTIYRNYFMDVNGKSGQTKDNQIDCLDRIGEMLENPRLNLWSMKNGYALPNKQGLLYVNKSLLTMEEEERESLKSELKVGIQWETEVTSSVGGHLVNQIYCSALPVAYSQIEPLLFEPFARLILEATYEATFYAAMRNMDRSGSNKLYLTLVGGGAFGNRMTWILNAISNSLSKFKNVPLDVKVVSFGRTNDRLNELLDNY